jgi:hypothetical protein
LLLLPSIKRLTTHLAALPPPLLTRTYKPIAQNITKSILSQSYFLTRHRKTSYDIGAGMKKDIGFFVRVVKDGAGGVRGGRSAWRVLEEVGCVIGCKDEDVGLAEGIVVEGDGVGWGEEDGGEWRRVLREKVGISIDETGRDVVRGLLRCRDVTSY